MQQARAENPLGTRKIASLLKEFSIPSIISMLVSSLYNVVDQIFIGQGVGYYGNAATTIAFQLVTICMAITLMTGIGSATQFSLALGKKQEEEAAKIVGHGFCMMIVFGTAFAVFGAIFLEPLLYAFGSTDTVFPYALTYSRIILIGMPFLTVMNGISNLARADGSPKYSMIIMVSGAVLNTILDPIFIFGLNWGIAGGAWATVIGQMVSFFLSVLYLPRFKRITLKKSYFRLSGKRIVRTMAMGMSNGITQLSMTIVQIVMNLCLVHFGAMTIYGADIPVAASGIVMKFNTLILAFIIGIVQGIQPILGYNYGARKYERVKETYKLAIKVSLIICIIGFACLELFPGQIVALFGSAENPLYYDFAVIFMRVFLMMTVLNGVQIISSNLFAAIGKPLKGALLVMTRQLLFLVPLFIILGNLFGLFGVVAAGPIADAAAFLIVIIFIRKEFREIDALAANAHT